MFNLFKRLFGRPRLIERYEDLNAIIEAYNKLIQKTIDIMSNTSVPPKYVLSRFKAIQDAEEKAIAAYWRNKDNKRDKWYKRPIEPENRTMTDVVQKPPQDNAPAKTQTAEALASPPSAEVLPPTQEQTVVPPAIEAQPVQERSAAPSLEPAKDNVIEIHINK